MSQDAHPFNPNEGSSSQVRINVWAVILAAVIMITVILAPRGMVSILMVFAVMGVVRLWRAPFRIRAVLVVPGLILVLLSVFFAGWMTLSTGWHVSAQGDVGKALRIVGLFAIGFIALAAPIPPDSRVRQDIVKGLLIGYIIAVILVAAAVLFVMTGHDVFWGSYFDDPLSTLNSRAVMVSLLLWPILLILCTSTWIWRAALSAAVLVILALTSSLASFVAILIGGLGLACHYFGRRAALIGLTVVLVLTTIGAPYATRLIGSEQHLSADVTTDKMQLLPTSARHRLAIWSFVSQRIQERPLLGWGFGASRSFPQEEDRFAENMEILPLHPHSLALQTRLELGIPGVFLLAAMIAVILLRTSNISADRTQVGTAVAAMLAWLFVANVSYGMWQNWWIASAFLIVILFRMCAPIVVSEDD